MPVRRMIGELAENESGATAIVYTLALFGILAMAGIGYDYAQIVSLDTEMQNAADQAALAAATQLTGKAGSIAAATAAASNMVSNKTIFAEDAETNRGLGVASVTFFATQADAEAGTPTTTSDTAARYVKVTMSARNAHYYLTPLVSLINRSPALNSAAVATLNSSLCKVPPVLICNPAANQAVFDVNSYVGKGLLMTFGNNGNTALSSGMMAFLDPGQTAYSKKNAINKQDFAQLIGYDTTIGNCISLNQPYTQSGTTTYVISAYNTRFDIFDNPDPIKCMQDKLCSPSDNSRKDLVQKYTGAKAPTSLNKNDCVLANGSNNGWMVSGRPYRPTTGQTYKAAGIKTYPDVMGYPRDLVHAYPGALSRGRIGTGVWDIDAYWNTIYGKAYNNDVTTAKVPSAPTRYEVYKWERATGKLSTTPLTVTTNGSKYAAYSAPMCYNNSPNSAPSATKPDRRVLSAAVVNCSALSGVTTAQAVAPLAWIDLFMVEPTINRTDTTGTQIYTTDTDVYLEVIGPTTQGSAAGSNGTQFIRKDKAYLVQ